MVAIKWRWRTAETGRIIGAAAAKSLKPITLELVPPAHLLILSAKVAPGITATCELITNRWRSR